jgi:tol-pal system protein YbgF
MTIVLSRTFKVLAFSVATLTLAHAASAQDSGSPFAVFGRIFGEGDGAARAQETQRLAQASQASPADLVVRLERMEGQIRQLTGVIEQLQYRNQQLEAQLKRMQEASGPQASSLLRAPPPGGPAQASPAVAGRRSDAFDPLQNPNAPGAPQTLGTLSSGTPLPPDPGSELTEAPVGAPGGRQPGSPLDLTTFGPNAANNPAAPSSNTLPPPPARNLSATGAVASVLPPSALPRDQYDLGYGYIQRKDYALAEDALQTFLTKFPTDKLVPDAQFWLGEARFQRQRFDAAAEAFLAVSTKHGTNAKAPEAMLRLGQSLTALGQREMACATFAEVGRKYPRAASNVRQGVEREQKRVRC